MLADVFFTFLKRFDRQLKGMKSHFDQLDELADEIRGMNQRLVSLEQDARQPRLTMEADVPADEKTRERTKGAATAVQAMHGDSVSAKRAQDGPKSSTTFGVKAEVPALPCRDGILVENGAAAPKSCFSPLEMRTPEAAGGLLPTGKTSTATRTTFDQTPRWLCLTEEEKIRNSIIYASYYRSFYLHAAPSCQRVIETKSGQNLMFDPGGFTGCLRACPFLGTRHALLCGEIIVRTLDEAAASFGVRTTRELSCRRGTSKSFTPYVWRSIAASPQPSWSENVTRSRTARGYLINGVNESQGMSWSEERLVAGAIYS